MKKILWVLVIAIITIPIVGASWSEWSPWWEFSYEHQYNFSFDVDEEWNMISIPWNESISKYDLVIEYDNVYSWNEAVEEGILIDDVYGWNTESQFYEFVDVLEPDRGYWIWSYHNITIKG